MINMLGGGTMDLERYRFVEVHLVIVHLRPDARFCNRQVDVLLQFGMLLLS